MQDEYIISDVKYTYNNEYGYKLSVGTDESLAIVLEYSEIGVDGKVKKKNISRIFLTEKMIDFLVTYLPKMKEYME